MNALHQYISSAMSSSVLYKCTHQRSFIFLNIKNQTAVSKLFSTSRCHQKIIPKNLKGMKKSSQMWLKRQLNDPYVEKAKMEHLRCRSAFKLLEIEDKHKLFKPGDIVIDCGAAPGSWSQVAVERVNATRTDLNSPQGVVISIDLDYIAPLVGANILDKSDFTHENTQNEVLHILDGRKADIVLSDMAPKASGVKFMDHDLIIGLCFSVLKFSVGVLKEGGIVLCKLWQGSDQTKLEGVMENMFNKTRVIKPPASRSQSAEVFLLGQGFRGIKQPN
ncbi:rRNA methyltransferase 2, mitochondrial-like [Gigantopelta aegis]|uniref:rRNA methyltransferase 2, mitochondrial-like n=1 Tax=Gigantopelta aegis TaxID=1735272 RepID=UPI001B88CDBA|nr:rRNA methyltransferase 2, mitochondrial-like [Gigantopelta aegis]